MERWACVDVPSLALQLLLEKHPDWRHHPVVVVDRDVAQGIVLEANRTAREYEIRPGIRYAAAVSLHRDVRAAVVAPDDLAEVHHRLTDHFLEFSPHVEPSTLDRGLFWLKASGLDRLFGSFEAWAQKLYDETCTFGFRTSISVGWTRFGTFATARADRVGWRHYRDVEDERADCGNVTLDLLGLDPKPLEALRKLSITRVSEFLDLPSSGVRKRFGEGAHRLWKFARGEAELPLQPIPVERPVERCLDLDEPVLDSTRLLFLLKSQLHPILLELAGRHLDLAHLDVALRLEDGDEREFSVRPATGTLEEGRIAELARLRLERVSLPAPIVRIELKAAAVPYRREQVHLFRRNARRDPHAAEHALARLEAEHGEHTVCRIALRPQHLPERSFELLPWTLHEEKPRPRSSSAEEPSSLVRRVYDRPLPLPRFDPEISPAWLIRDLDEGTVKRADGPYRITDSWWVPQGYVARDYWFAHTTRGDVFWVFWDHLRKQWFLHGVVS